MLDLFRSELTGQVDELTKNLKLLESGKVSKETIPILVRMSHSIKGGARILGFDSVVNLAKSLEEYFFAFQEGKTAPSEEDFPILYNAIEALNHLCEFDNRTIQQKVSENKDNLNRFAEQVLALWTKIEKAQQPAPSEKIPEKAPQKKVVEEKKNKSQATMSWI